MARHDQWIDIKLTGWPAWLGERRNTQRIAAFFTLLYLISQLLVPEEIVLALADL